MYNGRRKLQWFGELLFPRCCPICDEKLWPGDDTLCQSCSREILESMNPDYCPQCGTTVGANLRNLGSCPSCPSSKPHYDCLARVGLYQGPIQVMIQRYKFGQQQHLDRLLGRFLADAIQGQPWSDQIEAFIPVPTTWLGKIRYRCHPVGLLAQSTGRILHRPVLPVLKIKGKKKRQMELPQSQRLGNVRGVFHLKTKVNIADSTLCIIDDVMTIGATLRETAKTLKQAGAKRVYAAVLAKTLAFPATYHLA